MAVVGADLLTATAQPAPAALGVTQQPLTQRLPGAAADPLQPPQPHLVALGVGVPLGALTGMMAHLRPQASFPQTGPLVVQGGSTQQQEVLVGQMRNPGGAANSHQESPDEPHLPLGLMMLPAGRPNGPLALPGMPLQPQQPPLPAPG